MATHTLFNTHVRDNFTALGTHGHSGGAGDGAQAVGSLGVVTYADQSSSPGAAGTLQRKGSHLEYNDGAVVIITESDLAAGTPSLRSLGAGGTQASDGTHSH
jgi:hypothetical protein